MAGVFNAASKTKAWSFAHGCLCEDQLPSCNMSLVYDEFGRPFIIIKDQGSKSRLKGIPALKVCPLQPWIPLPTCFFRAEPPGDQ